MKKCFECGTTDDLQEHHVVPRLRGGTRTIPLCYSCHCRAHGRDSKGLEHSCLVREGIQNKFKQDLNARKEWGEARHRETTIMQMTEARVSKATDHTLKVGRFASEMHSRGETLQHIADTYMKMGVLTSRGASKWSKKTISDLIQRYDALTKEDK